MIDETIGRNVEIQSQTTDEDAQLVKDAKATPEAFGKLYDKYYPKIFRYIYHRTLDVHLTEDLTSQVFYAALRYFDSFQWRQVPFGAWLYRIATNETNKHYKRQKNRSVSLEARDENIRRLFETLEAQAVGPDENLVQSEGYALLHQAILTLKPKYQTVITLRFFESMAISEIGCITGRSIGTIKSQLHRALQKLRERLTAWEVNESQ